MHARDSSDAHNSSESDAAFPPPLRSQPSSSDSFAAAAVDAEAGLAGNASQLDGLSCIPLRGDVNNQNGSSNGACADGRVTGCGIGGDDSGSGNGSSGSGNGLGGRGVGVPAGRGGGGYGRLSDGGNSSDEATSTGHGLVLPFDPITITFRDVHYYVPVEVRRHRPGLPLPQLSPEDCN